MRHFNGDDDSDDEWKLEILTSCLEVGRTINCDDFHKITIDIYTI